MASSHSSSSSSSPLLVIGSGPSVVTWDCRDDATASSIDSPDASGHRVYRPFGSNNQGMGTASIADLAWNHNGQVLACCSTATATSLEDPLRKNIVLMSSHSGSMLDSFRHTDSSSDPTKNMHTISSNTSTSGNSNHSRRNHNNSTGPASTCVAFGGKSRYLCIGDQQGDVCLWDLKKQSRVRQFKSKKRQPCLQACLDPTATFVCSLSAETFTLYHLRQATFAKQWTFAGTSTQHGISNINSSNNHLAKGGWNQFRFSPLQPSLMALGDNTGRIQLHDGLEYEQPQLVCGGGHTSHVTASTTLLPHHASPITGLAFSTQNSKLLANIRLNGILEFVDTSTGEVIHHQPTGGNASALAFQGVSCVVGTETGEVQVYDLRKMMQQFGKAVTTYQIPGGNAISTLEFAPIPKTTTTTITGGGSGSAGSGRSSGRSRSPPSRRTSGAGPSAFGLSNAISFDLESRASMTSFTDPPNIVPNSSSSLTNTDVSFARHSNNSHNTAAAVAMNQAPPPSAQTADGRKPPSSSTTMDAAKGGYQLQHVAASSAARTATVPVPAMEVPTINATTGTGTGNSKANTASSKAAATASANSMPRMKMALNMNEQTQTNRGVAAMTSSGNNKNNTGNRNPEVATTSPAAAQPIITFNPVRSTSTNSNHTGSMSHDSQTKGGNDSMTVNGTGNYMSNPYTNDFTSTNANTSMNNRTTAPGRNNMAGSNKGPVPDQETASFLQNMVRQELQYHMFSLQEDVETSIRNLHVDMIRQFQRQSQEMMSVLRQQQHQIDQLMQENDFLRDQNAALQGRHLSSTSSPQRTSTSGAAAASNSNNLLSSAPSNNRHAGAGTSSGKNGYH